MSARYLFKSLWNDRLKIAFSSTSLCTRRSIEPRTIDYHRWQNFFASASGLVGKRVALKGVAQGGQKVPPEDKWREKRMRGGKYLGKIVHRKRQYEIRGIAAKEISSVNGDNPYPGSNDDGMDKMGWREKRDGREERKKETRGVSRKGGTTLSWFPSGGFIMASSYYRRIHGHDANLRQGTKADLTSTRIYGTSVQTE